MANPLIPASNPTSTNPVPAVVYDHWWIQTIDIDATDPSNVYGVVTLVQVYFDSGGNPVSGPDARTVQFVTDHLMQDPDPTVQAAIGGLIQAVVAKASALNLI
jgi:hypothetical protein